MRVNEQRVHSFIHPNLHLAKPVCKNRLGKLGEELAGMGLILEGYSNQFKICVLQHQ